VVPVPWIVLSYPVDLSPITKTPLFINLHALSQGCVARFSKRSYKMSFNIYVGNLSFDASEGELRTLFGEYGEVDTVKIISDQFTGRSRGFGFVEMQDREEGLRAVKELDSRELGGRTLKINEAKPKTSGGGGRRDGRDSRW
jgi:RNA recognition motif-containing protein